MPCCAFEKKISRESVSYTHLIEENIQVFDFVLSAEDMIEIDMLNKNHRTGPDPLTFHKK